MAERAHDAVLLDLDGTLVDDEGRIHPRTLAVLRSVHASGVRVMLATGRSEAATIPVLDELGFDTPAVVFNGAALYCPIAGRMLVERVLAPEAVRLSLEWAQRSDALPVVVRTGQKLALVPRSEHEQAALRYFHDLEIVEPEAFPTEQVIRVTVFSAAHDDSYALAASIEAHVRRPIYLTHFPLRFLAEHRANPLLVADVHPPCLGKAEGLQVLRDRYRIPPERVVAVGDATNDIPMFEAAGLGVAMANSMSEALEAADRVIGDNNTDTLADLLEELFL